MGESTNSRATLRFDRRVRLEFRGATITSDAGLLACRELDDALGLTETADECLQESRGGRNVQHRMVHGKKRTPYWIDRRLFGLAGPDIMPSSRLDYPLSQKTPDMGNTGLTRYSYSHRAGLRAPSHTL